MNWGGLDLGACAWLGVSTCGLGLWALSNFGKSLDPKFHFSNVLPFLTLHEIGRVLLG
jgi:hypothetical protein